MLHGRVIVLDIGKTVAKLSLWDEEGRLVARRQRRNARGAGAGRMWLDAGGIEQWASVVFGEFARLGPVVAIVPVAHGAAVAVVRGGQLAAPVVDYEEPIPADLRNEYLAQRDPFPLTGSPALPDGLNLGAQLHRIDREQPDLLTGDACLVPWPQYWAWRLCGVAASEVTSLGCHSDLWWPEARVPSALAHSHGWAARLAPLRRADSVLGTLSTEWAMKTGLARSVRIYCGLHDSNAALWAIRARPEVIGRELTVLTTGTWFVAMRLPAIGVTSKLAALPESRDCLVNVDVDGREVPSARYMGGRELEILGGLARCDPQDAVRAIATQLHTGNMVLPSWIAAVGPYPRAAGKWVGEPRDPAARVALLALYAALMVDASLELIGTEERLVVEGRFASDTLFTRTLAALRPQMQVLVDSGDDDGVARGALRLVESSLPVQGALRRVVPLACDLAAYKRRWRTAIGAEEYAA